MIAAREFYYDDLVIFTDENLKTCSVGLVTKEKPYSPSLLNTIKSNEICNDIKEIQDEKEILKDIINSSYESEDDDSSSDGNLYDPPQKEMVNVSWFIHKYISRIADRYDNTFIETIPGTNLQLYDRKLDISDIVKLDVNGKIKVGTVFNVKMRADVVILGHNKIIKNVDCSRMKWIEPLMGKNLETNYSYDSWLGEVLEISLEVIIRFSDGARLKVPDTLLSEFTNKICSVWNPEVILEGCIMEGNAQDLKSRKTKFIFETPKYNSKWLMKLKQEEIVQILVERATPNSANMQWVFGYGDKNGIVLESPSHTLKGKELEKLEPVHPYLWHCVTVGDIWYYQLEEGDKIFQLDSEEELNSVVYKMVNNQIDNCSELVVGEGDYKVKDQVLMNNPSNNQICSGCVVKPRKKVLCNIKSRTKRKQTLSISNAKSDSSSTSDMSSSDNEVGDDCKNLDNNVSVEGTKTDKDNTSSKEKLNHLNILIGEILNRIRPNNFVPVGILLTKSMVDISWQDGTVSYNVPSTKLNPQLYNIDEHEFFPGDFVEQKFDPLSPNLEQGMHNFGTVLSANSKDRVAKVQWFDYVSNSESSSACVVKSGEAEEIGVYDISALNEHHFVLGQEVLIKQEAAYKNYPAGYVTRLEPNDGLLVIRWPDGKEISISPTDLLLTVESAIGGGSDSSEDSGASEFSDDLSLDLQSDSDSSGWETVEEIETTQSDESYLSKLICARKDFYDLLDKIKKVKAILNSVTEFTEILQSKLPLHVSQMLSVKDIFKMARTDDDKSQTPHVNISFPEQQMAIRTLYEIRHNIGHIYKQCNDVGIKRMFECYRPKEFLSFRNIKNFIVSNAKFKYDNSLKNSLGNGQNEQNEKDVSSNTKTHFMRDMGLQNGSIINNEIESEDNSEENPNTVIGDYLITQYQNICAQLQYLQESIEVWLEEKSCYYNNELEMVGPCEEEHRANGVVDTTIAPIDNMIGQGSTANEVFDETTIVPNPDLEHILSLTPVVIEDRSNQFLSGDELVKPDFSERTLSTCEPIPDEQRGQFLMIDSAPTSHKFINSNRPSFGNAKFSRAWKRDINLLSTSLPKGVIVKSFDDRVDLFSVMIVGPSGTPYQHALFFFDIQLGAQYPLEPPSVFYISLASERVNPNLYTEGRVCLSLLGTWNGKGTENWDSKVSSLLQLIVSLQGLILVSEPYYNEAGFEIRKGSEEGKENSQRYNENAINNISQSMINLLHKPIPVFEKEISEHFKEFGNHLVEIHDFWSQLSEENLSKNKNLTVPDFPLAPVSKGFQLSIQRNVFCLRKTLAEKSW